jgi:tetratricopeptide (TPR) repeat protein
MSRLEKLLKMLAADPRDAFVLYAVAQEYAGMGEGARAVEFFDRCIEADATHAYAHFHKAKVLDDLGDRAGALAAAAKGLEVARASGEAKAANELAGLIDELRD